MFEKLFEGIILENDRLNAFGFQGDPLVWSQKIAGDKFILTIIIIDASQMFRLVRPSLANHTRCI